LQRRGFRVTVYAASIPPHTTSNMSLAAFTPASGLVAPDRRTPAWDAQFTRAAAISYRMLTQLTTRPYGVSWIDTYTATDDPTPPAPDPDEAGLLPDRISGVDREVFAAGEHPFPTPYAVRTRSLRIEPAVYLEALVRDVRAAGGRIVIRRVNDLAGLMELPEPIVVNCTGLGARELLGDEELVPVKGQMTLLAPQREITYRVAVRVLPANDPEALRFGMTPRADGILIGNLQERGNWSLEPNEDVQRRVMRSAMAFFDAMPLKRP
jgi:D-amino-acid oxidase